MSKGNREKGQYAIEGGKCSRCFIFKERVFCSNCIEEMIREGENNKSHLLQCSKCLTIKNIEPICARCMPSLPPLDTEEKELIRKALISSYQFWDDDVKKFFWDNPRVEKLYKRLFIESNPTKEG